MDSPCAPGAVQALWVIGQGLWCCYVLSGTWMLAAVSLGAVGGVNICGLALFVLHIPSLLNQIGTWRVSSFGTFVWCSLCKVGCGALGVLVLLYHGNLCCIGFSDKQNAPWVPMTKALIYCCIFGDKSLLVNGHNFMIDVWLYAMLVIVFMLITASINSPYTLLNTCN